MCQKRLSTDEVNFIMNMKEIEYSNCEIGRKMGVSEGAIRYQKKRSDSGLSDQRKNKPSELNGYDPIIQSWVEDYKDDRKRPTFKLLYENLRDCYGYKNSYDAVRRYVSKHFPEFSRKKTWIRISTPPGMLIQVDWKENLLVQMGEPGNLVMVQALVLTLGFSSKAVIVYSELKNLDSFVCCHQEGFRKLGGLVEFIRPDCLKSAVKRWRGLNSELNTRYESYIKRLGMEVFPSRPATATDKGKVEKRIRDFFTNMDFKHQVFRDMADLQQRSDLRLKELETTWRCSSTGFNVEKSFAYEKKYLRPLPQYFPKLPVRERNTRVRNDSTVYFCKNYYQVEREYRGKHVLCISTGEEIIIYHSGNELERYSYLPGTKGMVVLSEKALNDKNLKVSKLVRNWGLEVARRQVDIYYEITKGGVI